MVSLCPLHMLQVNAIFVCNSFIIVGHELVVESRTIRDFPDHATFRENGAKSYNLVISFSNNIHKRLSI